MSEVKASVPIRKDPVEDVFPYRIPDLPLFKNPLAQIERSNALALKINIGQIVFAQFDICPFQERNIEIGIPVDVGIARQSPDQLVNCR